MANSELPWAAIAMVAHEASATAGERDDGGQLRGLRRRVHQHSLEDRALEHASGAHARGAEHVGAMDHALARRVGGQLGIVPAPPRLGGYSGDSVVEAW